MNCALPTLSAPWMNQPSAIAARPSTAEVAESQSPVGTAEAERIGQCSANLHLARVVRYVIQIALGVDVEEVDGGWRNLLRDCERREHRFDPPRRAQQVTGHRLGRAHRNLPGMALETVMDGDGFGDIPERSRRAVRVDIVDLIEVELRIADRVLHGAHRALAVLAWRWHVMRVRAHAVTGELAVDLGAAPLRVLQLLEDHHPGAFAEHEAVTVHIPGAAGSGGIVVAGAERPHCRKSAQAEGR